MTVRELNREQLDYLKIQHVLDEFKKRHVYPPENFCEYAVRLTDQFIFNKYDGVEFVATGLFGEIEIIV